MVSPRIFGDLVMVGFCAGCIGAAYATARLTSALLPKVEGQPGQLEKAVNVLALVAVLGLTVLMARSGFDALGILG